MKKNTLQKLLAIALTGAMAMGTLTACGGSEEPAAQSRAEWHLIERLGHICRQGRVVVESICLLAIVLIIGIEACKSTDRDHRGHIVSAFHIGAIALSTFSHVVGQSSIELPAAVDVISLAHLGIGLDRCEQHCRRHSQYI